MGFEGIAIQFFSSFCVGFLFDFDLSVFFLSQTFRYVVFDSSFRIGRFVFWGFRFDLLASRVLLLFFG